MAYFAALYCLFQILTFAVLLRGKLKLTPIPAVPTGETPWPTVAIVVPARNEATTIEAGLNSLLRLDYPSLQILVVNDRSTDATGEILVRLAARDPRVTPLTVTELPPGWLGKNHAIHLAVARSQSDLLLFTDADVILSPSFLKRTVTLLERDHLDHLTALPGLITHDPILAPVLGAFLLSFSLFIQPWKNKDPNSKTALGVGAFNLLRRATYLSVGGHEAIRMRPDDDLALGRLMKQRRKKTDCVDGVHDVRVDWYPNAWELTRGLEKNALSTFDYSVVGAVCIMLLNPFFFFFPFAFPFFLSGTAQGFALAGLAVYFVNYAYQLRSARLSFWCLPALPFAGLFMCFIFARATVLTFWRGGIYWRGTFYSLDELRKNRLEV